MAVSNEFGLSAEWPETIICFLLSVFPLAFRCQVRIFLDKFTVPPLMGYLARFFVGIDLGFGRVYYSGFIFSVVLYATTTLPPRSNGVERKRVLEVSSSWVHRLSVRSGYNICEKLIFCAVEAEVVVVAVQDRGRWFSIERCDFR